MSGNSSIKGLLQGLLIGQLVLVFFQLEIRAFIDISLVRDICLVFILVFSLLYHRKSYKNRILTAVKCLIGYGILMAFVHMICGVPVGDSLIEFRNFFLPLFIVPIFYSQLMDEKFRKRIINLCFVLFIISVIDIYIEALSSLIGVSNSIFPWYQYQFTHLYRFSTSPDSMRTAISPEDSPVLGLQGWPLSTSATLVGLFAFLLPLIFSKNKFDGISFTKKTSTFKYLLILLTAGALVILQVKTSILAFLLVLGLFFLSSGVKAKRNILIIGCVLIILLFITRPLWDEAFQAEAAELEAGELEFIFSIETIGRLLSVFSNGSMLEFLFGGDLSAVPYFEDLEIRILLFTFELGLIWLILFTILSVSVLSTCSRCIKKAKNKNELQSLIMRGVLYSFIAYLIDMLHYANLMYLFNLSFMAVMLTIAISLENERCNETQMSLKV